MRILLLILALVLVANSNARRRNLQSRELRSHYNINTTSRGIMSSSSSVVTSPVILKPRRKRKSCRKSRKRKRCNRKLDLKRRRKKRKFKKFQNLHLVDENGETPTPKPLNISFLPASVEISKKECSRSMRSKRGDVPDFMVWLYDNKPKLMTGNTVRGIYPHTG